MVSRSLDIKSADFVVSPLVVSWVFRMMGFGFVSVGVNMLFGQSYSDVHIQKSWLLVSDEFKTFGSLGCSVFSSVSADFLSLSLTCMSTR